MVLYDGIEYPEVNWFQYLCSSRCDAQKWKFLEMATLQRHDLLQQEWHILHIIRAPAAAGHRGQFTFSDFDLIDVEN